MKKIAFALAALAVVAPALAAPGLAEAGSRAAYDAAPQVHVYKLNAFAPEARQSYRFLSAQQAVLTVPAAVAALNAQGFSVSDVVAFKVEGSVANVYVAPGF